ncbi:MAG: neocarzinostatin apoprotein domain-containing protein [Acidimicrobiales bacterium]
MAERAQAGDSKRGEWRVVAIVMASVLAVAGLGFGVTTIVDALEPEGCGPYGYGGYGGYGCEPIGDATLVVDPSTDLVDRQMVTVTGERFGPSTSFGAAQCGPTVGPSSGTDACDLSTARTTTTDSDGRVELTMVVRRIITVQGREVDCALESCAVGAATLSGTTPIEAKAVPISFDPDVPAIPRLTVELTVDDASSASMTGTVTCNRDAEAYVDATLNQVKGGHAVYAYGFADGPIACSTTPTEWTVLLSNGSGRLTGGTADFEAFASAYDGFDSASTLVTGETKISGGPARSLPPGENPGETVKVHIDGTSQSDDGLVVNVTVTCDRAVPEGSVYVEVTQWAGLEQVAGFGFADLGACDGVRALAVPISSFTGKLAGGPADVEAFVEIYDFTPTDEFFDYASARTSVRLRGSEGTTAFEVTPNPDSRITITGTTRDTLTGTIACEEPADVELQTVVQQSTGRTIDGAFGYEVLPCDGSTPFSLELDGELGGGRASAFVYAAAFEETEGGYEFLWDDQQAASLHVRG